MDKKLIQSREALADRQDVVLTEYNYDRHNPVFLKEMESIVAELREIANSGESDHDKKEHSKNWRYLGSALYDLGYGQQPNEKAALLKESAEAYERAESLLDGLGEAVEEGKLHYNYGNTLNALSFGEDASFMKLAEKHYLMARELFRSHAPDFVGQVEAQLQSLKGMLNLAKIKNGFAEKIRQLEKAKSTGEFEGVDTCGVDESFMRELAVIEKQLTAKMKLSEDQVR